MKIKYVFIFVFLLLLTACGVKDTPSTAGAVETEETLETEDAIETETTEASGEPEHLLLAPRARGGWNKCKIRVTLAEMVDNFPYIARIECRKSEIYKTGIEYHLYAKVLEWYQGDSSESEIELIDTDGVLLAGGRYLVFMEKVADVFRQETKYLISSVVYFDGNKMYVDNILDLENLSEKEVLNRLSLSLEKGGYRGDYTAMGSYIQSSNLEEIYDGSPNVVEVEIKRLWYPGLGNDRTWSECKVISVIKSEAPVEDVIEAVLPANRVEVGGRYILMLEARGNRVKYVVSSPNSVMDADSPEADMIRKK